MKKGNCFPAVGGGGRRRVAGNDSPGRSGRAAGADSETAAL